MTQLPVHMQGPQPVMVELGIIMNQPLYILLNDPQPEERERKFIRARHMLYYAIQIKPSEGAVDAN